MPEPADYEPLRRAYPDLAGAWVPPPRGGGPLPAPFVEVWANLHSAAPPLPLRFVPSQRPRSQPPTVPARLAAAVDGLLQGLRYTDRPKLRISRLALSAHEVVAEFQASTYTDYLRSNWAVANLPPADARELRAALCGADGLLPLEQSACANHLGVSAVLAFDGELLLPTSSGRVVSSPDMVVPSVSGSADFEGGYLAGQVPGPAQDILREAGEELGIGAAEPRAASARLLALTRNVLRGGKPEAFYAITLRHGSPDPRGCFELRDRAFIRLPALLDEHDRPVPRFDTARAELEAFVATSAHGKLAVSPFARVAVWYYLRWALARRGG